jgi:hypothetical protein
MKHSAITNILGFSGVAIMVVLLSAYGNTGHIMYLLALLVFVPALLLYIYQARLILVFKCTRFINSV